MSRRIEGGQMLAFFALLLPVLVLLMAVGVDAAYLYSQQRRAQAAADLAALGGARLLPVTLAATARARDLATANGYSTGVVVTAPFSADVRQIEVVITSSVRTFFMPIAGINSMNVTGRAVARLVPYGLIGTSMFAASSSCGAGAEKAIDWGANSITVTGAIHSNAGISLIGNTNTITGPMTYSCIGKYVQTGLANTLASAPQQTAVKPWPIEHEPADFPCTYSQEGTFDVGRDGPWWVGGRASGGQLLPGVYCATGPSGTLKMTRTGAQGTVTFVAVKQVELAGSNFNLVAHTNSVIAYSLGTASDAIKLSGNNGLWQGVMYAPNGGVDFTGNAGLTLAGSIAAQTIKLSGNAAALAPLPPSLIPDPQQQLIE